MAKIRDKIISFRKATEDELNRILDEKREKLRVLKFELAAGKIKDIREARETRRDIARILTILKEKKANKFSN